MSTPEHDIVLRLSTFVSQNKWVLSKKPDVDVLPVIICFGCCTIQALESASPEVLDEVKRKHDLCDTGDTYVTVVFTQSIYMMLLMAYLMAPEVADTNKVVWGDKLVSIPGNGGARA